MKPTAAERPPSDAAAPPAPAAKAPTAPLALVRALRPRQWIKNLVLLAGILFTLDQRHPPGDWLRVAAGIAVFCALASAIYLVNDLCDIEQDRRHPRKRHRPIAAGLVSVRAAAATAGALGAAGLAGAAALGRDFAMTAALYVALTLAYSFRLKHIVLLDVMALAGCYVLRAAAGAVVIGVEISEWLILCTTLGALLLGLAKRRNELMLLENAVSHRRILEEYSVPMLDQMIVLVTGATLVSYMLYTFTSATGQHRPMMLTIPFAIYGILRFFYLIHRHGKGGDPSTELVEDRNLLVCALLWVLAAALAMLYGR